MTAELLDTYRLWWGVAKGSKPMWISRAQFSGLSRDTRTSLVREQVTRRRGAVPTVRAWSDLLDPALLRAQAGGHRFVWWPSLLGDVREEILSRIVTRDRLPSRHRELDGDTWRRCEGLLPEAQRLGGTFPTGSNMNCFGAVMAAAGAACAEVFDDVAPFDAWLAARCKRGGDADRPGVVLVWRNGDRSPVHAAVSLGGGWALEKPSRDWHAPCAVATVADIMRMSRHPGERLERYTILP